MDPGLSVARLSGEWGPCLSLPLNAIVFIELLFAPAIELLFELKKNYAQIHIT